MWGMKGKLSDELCDIMLQYSKNHFYTSDQIYLSEKIWPIAEKNSLIHGFKEVEWMNMSKDEIKYDFVGQGYDENDNPLYDYTSSGTFLL